VVQPFGGQSRVSEFRCRITGGIWQVVMTVAIRTKTVRGVIDWMKSQNQREYDLIEDNYQDVASALSRFLSGKTPLRPQLVTLAVGAACLGRGGMPGFEILSL
jgi:hypothetical protein